MATSKRTMRIVTVVGLAFAAFTLWLAAAYGGDGMGGQDGAAATVLPNAVAPSGTVAGDGTDPSADGTGAAGAGTAAAASTSPIEEFLPRSGQASACREPVGVDLVEGYAADLTINGIRIAPEEMNVALDADGAPSNAVTASRSLGQYTYGPEDDCPNGRVLRPTDNVLEACVYRIEDGPASCTVSTNRFDVL
ncbi:MAG: hypothetical protein ACK5RL_11640 [Acidimicrobiales bacterium]